MDLLNTSTSWTGTKQHEKWQVVTIYTTLRFFHACENLCMWVYFVSVKFHAISSSIGIFRISENRNRYPLSPSKFLRSYYVLRINLCVLLKILSTVLLLILMSWKTVFCRNEKKYFPAYQITNIDIQIYVTTYHNFKAIDEQKLTKTEVSTEIWFKVERAIHRNLKETKERKRKYWKV